MSQSQNPAGQPQAPQAPQAPAPQAPYPYYYPQHAAYQQQVPPPPYAYNAPPPPYGAYPPPPYGGYQPPQDPAAYYQQFKRNKGCGGRDCSFFSYRRRRRRKRFLFFIGAIALIWATAAFTYRHGHKLVHFMQFRKLVKEMQISHTQRRELASIAFSAMEKNRGQRKVFRKMRYEFFKLMGKENLTQPELDAFLKKHTTQIQQLILSNSPFLLKARAVLSPHQRRILLVRVKQMQERRQRRRWRRWRAHHHHHRPHEG